MSRHLATVERNNSSRTRIREGGHLPRAVGGAKRKAQRSQVTNRTTRKQEEREKTEKRHAVVASKHIWCRGEGIEGEVIYREPLSQCGREICDLPF